MNSVVPSAPAYILCKKTLSKNKARDERPAYSPWVLYDTADVGM